MARVDSKPTVGFGCPDTPDPHYVAVVIPRGRKERIVILEHFGLRAEVQGRPEEVERVALDRAQWRAIAEPLRREFNQRLKEKGIATGRWQVGDNRVERLLGKELCVLAWAIERAHLELIPVAVTNWLGLKPEERWWLYTMTAAATGGREDSEVGWRKALRFALTENPTDAEVAAMPKGKPRRRARSGQKGLFDAQEGS